MSAEQIYNRGDLAEVHDPDLRRYLAKGWLLIPCRWQPDDKAPLIGGGFHAASNNAKLVSHWLKRWSRARWAVATGKPPEGSGLAIVDLDHKPGGSDGFATFSRLTGSSKLPETARVHTPSGGVHLYFQAPPQGCFSTVGPGGRHRPGLGPGIDFKCDLMQCHVPCRSPSSLYRWDDEFNLLTIPTLLPLPAVLTPVEVEDEEEIGTPPAFARAGSRQDRPAIGNINAYAEAALRATCKRIRAAVPGVQRKTLNDEAYAMGRLAAGLGLDRQATVDDLIAAGMAMQQQAGKPPWRRHEVHNTVVAGFRDGLGNPRHRIYDQPGTSEPRGANL